MKCGGQALNLNFANRVITSDPWWNSAIEEQAFGRVHRIGQQKETHFVRILGEGTVDKTMMTIQEIKNGSITAVMRDDKTPVTVDKLMNMFKDASPDAPK